MREAEITMEQPPAFNMAICQMRVAAGEPGRNRETAAGMIAEAARLGAQVALLPECCDLGWTDPSAATLAEPVPDGAMCRALADAARAHGLFVCAGLVEREGPAVYNSAVLIGPDGKLLLRHRKLNELEIGHAFYGQGDRLGVARTGLATFGVMICADAFARDLSITRALGQMGADVILSPCAWAVEAEHDNEREPYGALWKGCYGPPAREFRMWIIGASNVGPIPAGPWAGRRCIGCSLVVNDRGEPEEMLPYGVEAEMVRVVRITPVPRPARGGAATRKGQSSFAAKTRRERSREGTTDRKGAGRPRGT
jgi:predicted amidohydrolase